MEKLANTYAIRSLEISPNYRLQREYAGFYFQEIFAEFCALKEMAGYDMARIGLTWLISDSEISYSPNDMPFWREKVGLEVEAVEITPLFLNVAFRMQTKESTAATGKYRALIAYAKTHKPKRFTDFIEKFPNISGQKTTFEKFEISGEKIGEVLQKVRLPDLDFNRHLNNVRYLPRAVESMPESVREERRLVLSRLKFIKEAKLGDEILSETFTKDNSEFFHKLSRKSDGATICAAKTIWQ
ncbi:MAG: hypothetical protein J6R08_05600 [Opitutales bacterium]|nr:hypothetical protein [Opitutales bacterium]